MKVLVLGIGLQGKAAVYDLEKSPLIRRSWLRTLIRRR